MLYKIFLLLHILAATIWTGGHLVLAFLYLPRALKKMDISILEDFESQFEKLGIPALIVQVITGFYMAYTLLPSLGLWFDTTNFISLHVMVKLSLLLATIILALHARLRLIPNLSAAHLRYTAVHIILVTLFAVLFVATGVSYLLGGFF